MILSLNRLIGWVPEAFPENVPIPKEIKARYKNGSIAFSCDGIVRISITYMHILKFPLI